VTENYALFKSGQNKIGNNNTFKLVFSIIQDTRYNSRGLKLKVTHGPHQTLSNVLRAALKFVFNFSKKSMYSGK
jgi:hypothetical protein